MQEITEEVQAQRSLIEKQQDGDPNSIYADNMREDKIKNVIAQLNPELLLTDIEHRIRGERKNEYSKKWETFNDSKVSEELVQNFISFLNVYLTQNNSLSNYSADEINALMEVIVDYIKDDLSDNSEKYGFTTTNKVKIKVIKYNMKYGQNADGEWCYSQEPFETEQEIQIGDEMTDYNAMTKTGHIVCQSVFSVFKQAEKGMLAKRVFNALRVTESLNDGGKKSMTDVLKFW